jgi:hypothetical protein
MIGIVPMLALAALAACGGKDNDGETNGGVDTTATVAPTVTPMDTSMAAPTAPMATDSMGAMGDSMGGAAGANTSDTLIKVDSTKKM